MTRFLYERLGFNMIVDKIENLKLYKEIPSEVVQFISNLDIRNIKLGKHILSDSIYVNIEEYNTKDIEVASFESHDKYIDIQLLLFGAENIYYTSKENLNIKTPYDTNRDIAFYSDSVKEYPFIKLDGTNFMMIFPHEAHAPQVSINSSTQKVLKVVAKIKV